MSNSQDPIFLAGPTGSGKTAVALELTRLLTPAEIVNADAFQAYRGFEKLSAAPTAMDLAICPHHLYGILDPDEENDAASFSERVNAVIAEISARALPIVAGGSGLYLKAITHGLAPLPKADPNLRAELEKQSLDQLVERYRQLDPEGAAATNLKNPRHVLRNLEICLLSGRPASELKHDWARTPSNLRGIYLHRNRADLDTRIAQRTEAMFAAGIVDEVARLGALSITASKAIGIADVRNLIAGKINEDTCRESIRIATRRYAKRQESWFRREKDYFWLSVESEEAPVTTAERIAEHFGLAIR